MREMLYKLAIKYIGSYNAKWESLDENYVKSLNRLIYKNLDKYSLAYGADAEWNNFSRYDVLDNAVQKLAKYENEEIDIRNKAIDDFVNYMETCSKQIEEIRKGTVFFTMENIRDAANLLRGDLI